MSSCGVQVGPPRRQTCLPHYLPWCPPRPLPRGTWTTMAAAPLCPGMTSCAPSSAGARSRATRRSSPSGAMDADSWPAGDASTPVRRGSVWYYSAPPVDRYRSSRRTVTTRPRGTTVCPCNPPLVRMPPEVTHSRLLPRSIVRHLVIRTCRHTDTPPTSPYQTKPILGLATAVDLQLWIAHVVPPTLPCGVA